MTWANQNDPTFEKQIVFELNEEALKRILQSYIREVKKEPVPEIDDLKLLFHVGDERTEDGTVYFSFTQKDLDEYLDPKDDFNSDPDDENSENSIDTWNSVSVLPCGKDSCPVAEDKVPLEDDNWELDNTE